MSTILDGLSLGAIYALIALGYTMVYGIAKMLNFAHGDIIMVGAYAILAMTTLTGNMIVALAVAIVICTLMGVLIEKLAYKPLRSASPLAVLITAIGVSYFLQGLAQLIFGSKSRPITLHALGSLKIGNFEIEVRTVITLVVGALIMAGLTLFVKKTRTGRAMLAVSEDKGAAQLMGVNVDRIIMITFAIGSALAAVAGALLCSAYPSLSPYVGSMPGIKAFVAAVFGGIGSIPGAMIGGILLGVIENLSKAYISSQLSDAIVFGVLIVVLLVKPTGILGKNIQEKV